MALTWNEIRERANAFVTEWSGESSEDAEAKSFWDAFFHIFGMERRRVATFEKQVAKLGEKSGYIDLFWPGMLIVEHKSRGKNLDSAFKQAIDYTHGLKEKELPRFIVVSDFECFRLYDLEENAEHDFKLAELPDNAHLFGFIAGYTKKTYKEEDPVNIQAAELMGRLHDELYENGYRGHKLEAFLVRVLFCLFADDTGIFEKNGFREYLETRTGEDGADTGLHIAKLFEVLNTPEGDREKRLDEMLQRFPYVNGHLFGETLHIPSFDSKMRRTLLSCCDFDWSRISPAVFGSLFQYVMDPEKRRGVGAHYTSEKNILKVIRGLFLDELWDEFNRAKKNFQKLKEFHIKIANLKFLDPACGCGNFLIITYREIRLLEIEILKAMRKELALDIRMLLKVRIDQMYGIEIEEFPAKVAETALWLMDHLMNKRFCEDFGLYFPSVPLERSATIHHGNALRTDWNILLNPQRTVDIHAKEADIFQVSEPKVEYGKVNLYVKSYNVVDPSKPTMPVSDIHFDYIFGNPPFVGAKYMDDNQRADAAEVFVEIPSGGLLDYVAGWYVKTMHYLSGSSSTCAAFVSTNSITQGEQVGVLWKWLLAHGITIRFAHRTFRWTNEASGQAAVHCVIIGFGKGKKGTKRLYEYDDINGDPHEVVAGNINPYLVDAPDTVITRREKPISPVPEIGIGNKPIDGGNYLFTPEEKEEFLRKEPQAAPYFKRWIGGDEFLNGYERWCLWLGDCPPHELRKMPEALKRVEAVAKFRAESKSAPTRKLASIPTRFHVENMPDKEYLLIPKVSSERRKFIPVGFLDAETLSSDLVFIFPHARKYHFGILSSTMHMAWMRSTAGRLESRYRYSVGIVYNNFPWPENPSEKLVKAVEEKAQAVLDARAKFSDSSLADLYDPRTMPPELIKAHSELDRAVEKCYRSASFKDDKDRIAFLFERYAALSGKSQK